MEGRRKRKPLSDISSTYNLIPTSALRKLVAASTNSSSCSKPPLSILKSSSVSSNQKLHSECSNRSDISIGSSSVRGASNSRTVQFHTPPREISSITRSGGRGGKAAQYSRKQTTEKLTKESEDDVLVVSPTFAEKRKNKGKDIAVPFSSSPPDKTNDNQNKFVNPNSLLKRENQKGSAYRNLFSGLVEMAKESKKSTLNSHSRPYGKADKAKGIADYSSFSLEKTIDGGKSGSSSDGKKGVLKQSGLSVVKTKETGKLSVDPNFLVERTKEKVKPLDPVGYSIERTMEKGKAIMQLPEFVEVTKSKGSSAAVKINTRTPRRKSVKRKTDAGAYSCPPMTRSKNLQIDLGETEDLKSSKSWTAHPKSKKRLKVNDTTELPPEFVKQQNEYYKEIDAFELPEEEISVYELD